MEMTVHLFVSLMNFMPRTNNKNNILTLNVFEHLNEHEIF
jgi:hypothetical protein